MATRKPRVYCPICGRQLQFQVVETANTSTKPGPTNCVMLPHACDPHMIQQFCEQQEREQEAREEAREAKEEQEKI